MSVMKPSRRRKSVLKNHPYRLVFTLVIDVDEAPIDVGQILQLILQVLGNVMGSPKGHLSVEHDVDLDVVFRARVADTAAVNRLDIAVKGHGLRVTA